MSCQFSHNFICIPHLQETILIFIQDSEDKWPLKIYIQDYSFGIFLSI